MEVGFHCTTTLQLIHTCVVFVAHIRLVIAIHDIFASNAEKFPDRECVVETKSARTNARSFSYRQINESSNQLANHLLAHDAKVGDVAVIYAYRGLVSSPPSSTCAADRHED